MRFGRGFPQYSSCPSDCDSPPEPSQTSISSNSVPVPAVMSGTTDITKEAADAEGCDFPGFGPHSLRRANITWRQKAGGSSIEKRSGSWPQAVTSSDTWTREILEAKMNRLLWAAPGLVLF